MYYFNLECVKSFCLDGGSMPILEGEVFAVCAAEPDVLTGVEGCCINPGMEITLHDEQFVNFKFREGYNL